MDWNMILAEAADASTYAAADAAGRFETIQKSFELMGYGMAGIFITIFIIMVFVWLLGKIKSPEKNE